MVKNGWIETKPFFSFKIDGANDIDGEVPSQIKYAARAKFYFLTECGTKWPWKMIFFFTLQKCEGWQCESWNPVVVKMMSKRIDICKFYFSICYCYILVLACIRFGLISTIPYWVLRRLEVGDPFLPILFGKIWSVGFGRLSYISTF